MVSSDCGTERPRSVRLWTSEGLVEPEDTGDGFGVLDRAAHDHANRGRKRHHAKVNDFIGFRWSWDGAQATRQKQIHGLGQKARTSVEAQNSSPARCGVARLLQEFA